MLRHILNSRHVYFMLLLRAFTYYTLSHNNRQFGQERTHHTLRLAQMQHLVLIHLAGLITLQLLIKPRIDRRHVFRASLAYKLEPRPIRHSTFSIRHYLRVFLHGRIGVLAADILCVKTHIGIYHANITQTVFNYIVALYIGRHYLAVRKRGLLRIHRPETETLHILHTIFYRQRLAVGEVYYRLSKKAYKLPAYLAITYNLILAAREYIVEQRNIVYVGTMALNIFLAFRYLDDTLAVSAMIHIGIFAAAYRLLIIGKVRYICMPVPGGYRPPFEELFLFLLNSSLSFCTSAFMRSDCALRYSAE